MRSRVDAPEDRLAKLLQLHELLAGVSRRIGPALAVQPVLATVLEAMRSLVAFRGGSVCLIDGDGAIAVAAADPPMDAAGARLRVGVGQGLVGLAIATGEAVYSPDLDADPRVDPEVRRSWWHPDARSWLGVPLVCLGRVIGVMQVDAVEGDAFDADDLQVLEGLATQVAGAIESARRHEEIVELERMKSDFVARASHELRTPLTIVSGFTETLVARWPQLDDGERSAILGRMQVATQRLERLVHELVALAGFEAGVISPQPVDVALAPVIEEVRGDADKPEQVSVRCPADLVVHVDPALLRHALRLLVDNALRYAGDAEVVAVVDAESGQVVIDIVDHGPGVAPQLRSRIFDRFTRGDDTQPGMGLGLALVRMLAGGCGARVEMHHPAEGGAVFRLRFDGVLAGRAATR